MLDVFVVALLAGLVRIQGFAEITAGVGIAAFGAVVVLTMLASLSFDPRLTWDTATGLAGRAEQRVRPMICNRSPKTHPLRATKPRPRWPQPRVVRRRNWLPSLIWLIPIVAALVGITLVARILLRARPRDRC